MQLAAKFLVNTALVHQTIEKPTSTRMILNMNPHPLLDMAKRRLTVPTLPQTT